MSNCTHLTDGGPAATGSQDPPGGGARGELARELAAEQQYVDRVYVRFEQLRAEMEDLEAEGHERARLGHEGGLFERDVLVLQAARRMHQLDRAHEGLVFGRMDLDSGVTRYVGRLGLRDERQEPLILDWRAPAAGAFYRATPQHRSGVVRRRIIDCRRQRVVGIEDDLLAPELAPPGMRVVGDGSLMAALTRSRGAGMQAIVATIQREQDEAVRAPAAGATLITGGPGTGKTAVALHRVAYLLYQERRRFERGGVLIVGPSSVFLRFIDRVLPSLGESSTSLAALGSMVPGFTTDEHDPPPVAALKGSLRMRSVLSKAVRLGPVDGPEEFRMMFHGDLLRLDAKELLSLRRGLLTRNRRYHTVRPDVPRAVAGALWLKYSSDQSQRMEAEEFRSEILDRPEIADFVAQWWPILDPRRVLQWLGDPSYLRRCSGRSFTASQLAELSASWASGRTTVEDVALLDEALGLLGAVQPQIAEPAEAEGNEYAELLTADVEREAGAAETGQEALAEPDDGEEIPELVFQEPERYAHIVVDEAQDLSPMQWRMLARRGPQASWTVVGDPLQSIWIDRDETTDAMNSALRRGPRRQFRLDVNYRNPVEIFAVAERVIRRHDPEAQLPQAVRRTDQQPQHRIVGSDDLAESLAESARVALDAVEGTVAVVCPAALLDPARAWLRGSADPRLQVLSARDSKGVEFDAVVVVEPQQIIDEVPAGERLLYVVLSRATQRLTTVSTQADWLP